MSVRDTPPPSGLLRTLAHRVAPSVDTRPAHRQHSFPIDGPSNRELYAPDVRYTDVTTFGRTVVGIDEFVACSFAFFEAIPDWRYDLLPDRVYLEVTPEGKVRTVIRYIGSGHWTGPLRLYPYDDTAPRGSTATGGSSRCRPWTATTSAPTA